MCPELVIRRPLRWLPSVRNNNVPYAAEEFYRRTKLQWTRPPMCCADGKMNHHRLADSHAGYDRPREGTRREPDKEREECSQRPIMGTLHVHVLLSASGANDSETWLQLQGAETALTIQRF